MIGGQVMDLSLRKSHRQKSWNTSIPTKPGRSSGLHQSRACFRSFRQGTGGFNILCENFGLAFQITDDLLDITGNLSKMGKSSGSDSKNKATYPAVYGFEESRRMAAEAVQKAKASLDSLPGNTDPLGKLADYLLERES